jgi:hypothetical protein
MLSIFAGVWDCFTKDQIILCSAILIFGISYLYLIKSYVDHSERLHSSFIGSSCRHGSSAMSLKESDRRMNPKDTSLSPDSMPMKELIAAAHARRLSQPTSFIDSFLDSNVISPSANIPSAKEGSGGRCSPSNNNTIRSASDRVHTQQNSGTILFDDMEQKSLNKLPGHDEARSARRAFENFLGTLTRTKECIARATRLALDCAKHGIAGEVRPCNTLQSALFIYKHMFVGPLYCLLPHRFYCCC